MRQNTDRLSLLLLGTYLLLAVPALGAVRLKDISQIQGVRENQIYGYGLVVGLDGTGDDTEFTFQSLEAYLRSEGVTVREIPDADNVAAVIVTANLPAFARPGSKLDILVSSVGDCETLQGGTLLMTPLRAADGKVYAVAQGPLSIGGFKAAQGGTSIQENHATVGQVANGATIEREVAVDLSQKSQVTVTLNNPDFVTAVRVTQAINLLIGENLARPVDPGTISILIPAAYQGRFVEFVSVIETIPVNPDHRAKIVLDERTGTVIMGENVRISTIAIAHGSLSILITSDNAVSQPNAFSGGVTAPVRNTALQAIEEGGEERNLNLVEEGVTISELITALNALGVSPRDLIAILQAIKMAGALQADLEVI